MTPPNEYLKEEFKRVCYELICNPKSLIELTSINVSSRVNNRTGQLMNFYTLGLKTNVLELVFGKDRCLKTRIEERLRGQIEEKFGLRNIFVYIDVEGAKKIEKNYEPDNYLAVPIKEGLERGIIAEHSPIAEFSKDFGIEYMLFLGSWVIGPSVELGHLINIIIPHIKPHHVLDLFCGTGAISKVALINGTSKVTCMDLNITFATQTLRELRERVEFVQRDVFSLDWIERYDIVVADPPHILAWNVVEELTDKIKEFSDLFIFYHGHSEQIQWNKEIREVLKEKFRKQLELDISGASITLCSGNDRGNNYLRTITSILENVKVI